MRVAVLVDGDNLGDWAAEAILKLARAEGTPDILRVYTNAERGTGWSRRPSFRIVHTGTGKNATDIALAVDAVELALRERIQLLIIASSDGDFRHLALRLRELGHGMLGVGEAKAPAGFRAACTGFRVIAPPSAPANVTPLKPGAEAPTPGAPPPAPPAAQAVTDRHHLYLAETLLRGQGPLPLATLGSRIGAAAKADAMPSKPPGGWRAFFARHPDRFALDGDATATRIRLTGAPPLRRPGTAKDPLPVIAPQG